MEKKQSKMDDLGGPLFQETTIWKEWLIFINLRFGDGF